MASDGEISCINDPNFAVICQFIERFGEQCGVTIPDFLTLQEWLENTEHLSQELVALHIKLLRKIYKSVKPERWENTLCKITHRFSPQDAWEVERFGYKMSRTSSKVLILKNLLEMQFDYHVKFKGEINKLSADELRSKPIGKDKNGHSYWYMIDELCQLRVYKEDPDEETCELVAKDREGLIKLINELSGEDVIDPNINDDSNSLGIEKPITDTGQLSSSTSVIDDSSNSHQIKTGFDQKDESTSSKEDIKEPETNKPELKIEEISDNAVDLDNKKEINDSKEKSALNPEEKSESDNDSEEKQTKDPKLDEKPSEKLEKSTEVSEEIEEPVMIIKGEGSGKDCNIENPFGSQENNSNESQLSEKIQRRTIYSQGEGFGKKLQFSDVIEEPVMFFQGEGLGTDCSNQNSIVISKNQEDELEFSEVIEEPIMFFYGEGSGFDCQTGNDEKSNESSSKNQSESNSHVGKSESCSNIIENQCSLTKSDNDTVLSDSTKNLDNVKPNDLEKTISDSSRTSVDTTVVQEKIQEPNSSTLHTPKTSTEMQKSESKLQKPDPVLENANIKTSSSEKKLEPDPKNDSKNSTKASQIQKSESIPLENESKTLQNDSTDLKNNSKSLEIDSKSLEKSKSFGNESKSLKNDSKPHESESKSLNNESKSLDNESKTLETDSKSLEKVSKPKNPSCDDVDSCSKGNVKNLISKYESETPKPESSMFFFGPKSVTNPFIQSTFTSDTKKETIETVPIEKDSKIGATKTDSIEKINENPKKVGDNNEKGKEIDKAKTTDLVETLGLDLKDSSSNVDDEKAKLSTDSLLEDIEKLCAEDLEDETELKPKNTVNDENQSKKVTDEKNVSTTKISTNKPNLDQSSDPKDLNLTTSDVLSDKTSKIEFKKVDSPKDLQLKKIESIKKIETLTSAVKPGGQSDTKSLDIVKASVDVPKTSPKLPSELKSGDQSDNKTLDMAKTSPKVASEVKPGGQSHTKSLDMAKTNEAVTKTSLDVSKASLNVATSLKMSKPVENKGTPLLPESIITGKDEKSCHEGVKTTPDTSKASLDVTTSLEISKPVESKETPVLPENTKAFKNESLETPCDTSDKNIQKIDVPTDDTSAVEKVPELDLKNPEKQEKSVKLMEQKSSSSPTEMKKLTPSEKNLDLIESPVNVSSIPKEQIDSKEETKTDTSKEIKSAPENLPRKETEKMDNSSGASSLTKEISITKEAKKVENAQNREKTSESSQNPLEKSTKEDRSTLGKSDKKLPDTQVTTEKTPEKITTNVEAPDNNLKASNIVTNKEKGKLADISLKSVETDKKVVTVEKTTPKKSGQLKDTSTSEVKKTILEAQPNLEKKLDNISKSVEADKNNRTEKTPPGNHPEKLDTAPQKSEKQLNRTDEPVPSQKENLKVETGSKESVTDTSSEKIDLTQNSDKNNVETKTGAKKEKSESLYPKLGVEVEADSNKSFGTSTKPQTSDKEPSDKKTKTVETDTSGKVKEKLENIAQKSEKLGNVTPTPEQKESDSIEKPKEKSPEKLDNVTLKAVEKIASIQTPVKLDKPTTPESNTLKSTNQINEKTPSKVSNKEKTIEKVEKIDDSNKMKPVLSKVETSNPISKVKLNEDTLSLKKNKEKSGDKKESALTNVNVETTVNQIETKSVTTDKNVKSEKSKDQITPPVAIVETTTKQTKGETINNENNKKISNDPPKEETKSSSEMELSKPQKNDPKGNVSEEKSKSIEGIQKILKTDTEKPSSDIQKEKINPPISVDSEKEKPLLENKDSETPTSKVKDKVPKNLDETVSKNESSKEQKDDATKQKSSDVKTTEKIEITTKKIDEVTKKEPEKQVTSDSKPTEPVPVVEEICIKKTAYVCEKDDETNEKSVQQKVSPVDTESSAKPLESLKESPLAKESIVPIDSLKETPSEKTTKKIEITSKKKGEVTKKESEKHVTSDSKPTEPIPIVEEICIKKTAYVCGKGDETNSATNEKALHQKVSTLDTESIAKPLESLKGSSLEKKSNVVPSKSLKGSSLEKESSAKPLESLEVSSLEKKSNVVPLESLTGSPLEKESSVVPSKSLKGSPLEKESSTKPLENLEGSPLGNKSSVVPIESLKGSPLEKESSVVPSKSSKGSPLEKESSTKPVESLQVSPLEKKSSVGPIENLKETPLEKESKAKPLESLKGPPLEKGLNLPTENIQKENLSEKAETLTVKAKIQKEEPSNKKSTVPVENLEKGSSNLKEKSEKSPKLVETGPKDSSKDTPSDFKSKTSSKEETLPEKDETSSKLNIKSTEKESPSSETLQLKELSDKSNTSKLIVKPLESLQNESSNKKLIVKPLETLQKEPQSEKTSSKISVKPLESLLNEEKTTPKLVVKPIESLIVKPLQSLQKEQIEKDNVTPKLIVKPLETLQKPESDKTTPKLIVKPIESLQKGDTSKSSTETPKLSVKPISSLKGEPKLTVKSFATLKEKSPEKVMPKLSVKPFAALQKDDAEKKLSIKPLESLQKVVSSLDDKRKPAPKLSVKSFANLHKDKLKVKPLGSLQKGPGVTLKPITSLQKEVTIAKVDVPKKATRSQEKNIQPEKNIRSLNEIKGKFKFEGVSISIVPKKTEKKDDKVTLTKNPAITKPNVEKGKPQKAPIIKKVPGKSVITKKVSEPEDSSDGELMGFDNDFHDDASDSDEKTISQPIKRPLLTVVDITKLQSKKLDDDTSKPVVKPKGKPLSPVEIIDDNSNDVIAEDEKDPLACDDEEVKIVKPKKIETQKDKINKNDEKGGQKATVLNFSMDHEEDIEEIIKPTPIRRSLRGREVNVVPIPQKPKAKKRPHEPTPEKEKEDAKKIKTKGKRVIDTNLRKSIEEQKNKVANETSDEEDEEPKKTIKGKKKPSPPKGKKRVDEIKDETNETPESDASETPPKPKKNNQKKNSRILLGLPIDECALIEETSESGRPLRASRRLAQIKMRESVTHKASQELAFAEAKAKLEKDKKKNKKKGDKEYKPESKKKKGKESDDDSYGDEENSKSSMKSKKKKKDNVQKFLKGTLTWKSSTDDSENEDEEEEYVEEYDYEEDIKIEPLKSDHEFSPESDVEDSTEIQPTRRARTVKKESDADEPEDVYACQKCNKNDHPEMILLCDKCDNGWHCSCLRPALLAVPEGEWFCPPCQHLSLIEALKERLIDYDKKVNRLEMEERRKERLAYVGISLQNVLPTKDKSDKKKKGHDSEDESESSSSESSSGSSSEDSDEPIYQLRQRRQAQTYRFNDYDELINSAIQDEIEAEKGAGNQGRGKDISTIVNAEKEEKAIALREALEQKQSGEKPEENNTEKDHDEEKEKPAHEDSEEEMPRVVPKQKGRKKSRKLNNLDINSEDEVDDDESFKGSESEEEEEFDEDLDSEDDSDGYIRGRRKPVRRSTRARRTRYDDEFINDDSDDDKPKKKRSIWDESEESEDSDKSWGGKKKKRRSRAFNELAALRGNKKLKKKKKRYRDENSDGEKPKKKRPRIVYGGLDDSDSEDDRGIRTRGKKINYVDTLGSDESEEEKKKPRVIESEEEYVANEEEDDEEEIEEPVIDDASSEEDEETPKKPTEKEISPIKEPIKETEKSPVKEIIKEIPKVMDEKEGEEKESIEEEAESMEEEEEEEEEEKPSMPKKIITLPMLEKVPKSPRARGRGRGFGGPQRPQKVPKLKISTLMQPHPVPEPQKPQPQIAPEPKPMAVVEKLKLTLQQKNIKPIEPDDHSEEEEEVAAMMESEEYANKQLELMAKQIQEKRRREFEAQQLRIAQAQPPPQPIYQILPQRIPQNSAPLQNNAPPQNNVVPQNNAPLQNPPISQNPVAPVAQEPKKRGRRKKFVEGVSPLKQQLQAKIVPPLIINRSMITPAPILNEKDEEKPIVPQENVTDLPPVPQEKVVPPVEGNPIVPQENSVPSIVESPPKRRGRGKGKKTLAAEAAKAAMAAGSLEGDTHHSSDSHDSNQMPENNFPPGKLTVAAPPQPFSQSQPAPSVITRMLQSPLQQTPFTTATNAMNQKYFGTDQPQRPQGQFGNIAPRGRVPSPFRTGFPLQRPINPSSPHRLRSPGPQMMYTPHHNMDPSPSGGGHLITRDTQSPLENKGTPPPPPQYNRPITRFPPPTQPETPQQQQQPPPPPPNQTIRPFQATEQPTNPPTNPPTGNFPQYPNQNTSNYYNYPPPPNLTPDDALPPTVYQNSYPEPYNNPENIPASNSEESNSKTYDEEESGEFGGLVSYFSSQREDDLDT